MALTPKPHEALLLAHGATGHGLQRCRGGWCDKARPGTPVVTTRTANTLVDMGLADYDDAMLPSTLTLTAYGVSTAQAAQQMPVAA
ncbi:MAG: hypothetical protein ACK40R_00235 [Thermomonas sp.]